MRIGTSTGTTTILGGRLKVGSSTALGDGNVTVGAGGVLDLSTAGLAYVIADTATLSLGRTGSSYGRVDFGPATLEEVVNELFVDGVLMSPGTYTSASLPNYLVGAGSLTVLTGSPVPEPTGSVLLLTGALALLPRRWRRRPLAQRAT